MMISVDELIKDLFRSYWHGGLSIGDMKGQLRKSLQNQIDGFWSGSSAYEIMTKGGFLVDGKRGANKRLTALGREFMEGGE